MIMQISVLKILMARFISLRILNDSQSYDIRVLVIPIRKKQIRSYITDLQVVEFEKMNV